MASRRSPRILSSLVCALFVFAALAAAADTGAAVDERIQRSFSLKSGGSALVENDRGSTTIEGWDKEEVSVQAVKHYEGDESRRAEWMQQTQVLFTDAPGRFSVRVQRPNNFCVGWCDYHAWVDLTVRVPRRVTLEVRSDRTPTRISGIEGTVEIRGDRSAIDLRGIRGGIRITSDRGPVRLEDVEIRSGVDVSTDRADIELRASRFAQGGRLRTGRAGIRVVLPEKTPLSVEVARDRRSTFSTDFALSTTGSLSGYGTLRGDINGGGPLLRLETDRGSISLVKGGPGRAAVRTCPAGREPARRG